MSDYTPSPPPDIPPGRFHITIARTLCVAFLAIAVVVATAATIQTAIKASAGYYSPSPHAAPAARERP